MSDQDLNIKQGPPGEPGPQGEPGERGPQGDQGPAGERGEPGSQGERGERGEAGERGEHGEKGEKGDRGESGVAGRDGTNGTNGANGQAGRDGQPGQAGSNGEKGDQGEKGDKGEPGEQGPPGQPAPVENRNDNDKLRLDRAAMEIKQLWALINKRRSGTGGSVEYVALTLSTGTGGTATTAASFTYNFTTVDNIAHNNVSPAHQRLNAAKKATIGAWDAVQLKLQWTDEIPDPGGCA